LTRKETGWHGFYAFDPYREPGGDPFDQRRPEIPAGRSVKRLEKLRFHVDFRLSTLEAAQA
jgi:hypothetical protein